MRLLLLYLLLSLGAGPVLAQQKADDDKPNDPRFLFGVGGSFDLLDDVISNVFFSTDVLVHHLGLDGEDEEAAWWEKQGSRRSIFGLPEGIRAGFYRGTTPTEVDTNTALRVSYTRLPRPDSLLQLSRRVLRMREETRDILGVYFSSLRMVSRNVGWVLHAELQKRSVDASFEDSVLVTDTVRVVPVRQGVLTPGFSSDDRSILQQTTYRGYLGAGLLLHYRNTAIDLRVQPIVAWGSSTGLIDPRAGRNVLEKWRDATNYIVHFQVMEKELGIAFGGNVRGSFAGENPDLMIYFSKNFDLSRLSDKIKF